MPDRLYYTDSDEANELIASDPSFRALVARSKAGARKPFPLGPDA